MTHRPATWGSTATITDEAGRRAERMAYVGMTCLLLLALANLYGAHLPAEAFLAVGILTGAGSLGTSYVGRGGAEAHASQYEHLPHPSPEQRPVPPGEALD